MPINVICWFAILASTACAHVAAAPSARLVPGDHDLAISHSGRVRHYLVHVPPQATQGTPLPVIVNFHGGGGTAQEHQRRTNMAPLADREGILVVFPDGTGPEVRRRQLHTWNAGVCCGSAAKQNIDDVAFTFAVL